MRSIILSHNTALAYWSLPQATRLACLNEESTNRAFQSAEQVVRSRTIKELRSSLFYEHIPIPLDILVPNQTERRRTKTANYHYCKSLPPGSLSIIDRNTFDFHGETYRVLACSPELTLMQMAKTLDDIELLEIAFELCGCYSLHPNAKGDPSERVPVSSPKQIEEFIDNVSGISGVRKLRNISRWILPNSRSPKESQLAIAAILPRERGGFGMPYPVLNPVIDVAPNIIPVLGSPKIIPDMFWKDQDIVFEYDSDFAHDESTADHDARKRSAYQIMGLDLVSLTPDQLNDRAAFENIMGSLGRQLSPKQKPPTATELSKRLQLYKKLFSAPRHDRCFIMVP